MSVTPQNNCRREVGDFWVFDAPCREKDTIQRLAQRNSMSSLRKRETVKRLATHFPSPTDNTNPWIINTHYEWTFRFSRFQKSSEGQAILRQESPHLTSDRRIWRLGKFGSTSHSMLTNLWIATYDCQTSRISTYICIGAQGGAEMVSLRDDPSVLTLDIWHLWNSFQCDCANWTVRRPNTIRAICKRMVNF